jgi:ribonuclease J
MAFRILPLGGLGEIGMNCMAIEIGTSGTGPIVIVDCGISFPSVPNGVELIHPDFSWLVDNRDRVAALLVTHGHEDHIGAIPYLLRRFYVPVYAPPYALGLIRERMKEHLEGEHPYLKSSPETYATKPRVPFTLRHGSHTLEVEPIRVTHSIADATALAIRTDQGTLVHTGDFKIDPDPTDGEQFDRERLRALGDEGVSLLLSDSTNVDSPGVGRSERVVAEALDRVVADAPGRVVVGLFASNVHRLRALAEAARRHQRKIVLLGRSVGTHVRVANETGYLAIPPDLLISVDEAAVFPRQHLMVLATGSQAEPRAALSRLALDDHPKLRLEPGDRVILSSRAIPGNEVEVMRMVGDLHRRGCEVIVKQSEPDIHASGHAHRDEQREMIDLVRPAAFVPVHGTRHHMERHAALARDAGVRDVLVIENGEVADIDRDGPRKNGVARVGKISVQANEELAEIVMRDRRGLGELGVAVTSITVDESGRPVGEPVVVTRGVLEEVARPEALAEARSEVKTSLAEYPWSVARPNDDEIREVARLAVRRALARHVGFKPISLALVHRPPSSDEPEG